ncbi:hypothetical protein ACOME3_004866 [Neoechinorhynchus agilis]
MSNVTKYLRLMQLSARILMQFTIVYNLIIVFCTINQSIPSIQQVHNVSAKIVDPYIFDYFCIPMTFVIITSSVNPSIKLSSHFIKGINVYGIFAVHASLLIASGIALWVRFGSNRITLLAIVSLPTAIARLALGAVEILVRSITIDRIPIRRGDIVRDRHWLNGNAVIIE